MACIVADFISSCQCAADASKPCCPNTTCMQLASNTNLLLRAHVMAHLQIILPFAIFLQTVPDVQQMCTQVLLSQHIMQYS